MNNLSGDNTTPGAQGLPLTQLPEYRASVILWQTLPPCILLLGGFGNIATIFVMRRIKDNNSSQHVILMALAMSDLTCLAVTVPDQWTWYVFRVDVMTVHSSLCKFYYLMPFVSTTSSAWLVTCVTVQRTMAVLWPHRMRGMCTVRRTWIVIAVVVLSAFVVYCHVLFGIGLNEENECRGVTEVYRWFIVFVFNWIDLCLASFFPGVCLIVCDVILSVTLFQAMWSMSPAARAQGNVNTAHSTTHSRRKTFYRTTAMVLAISCSFLVLTLPVCVLILWINYANVNILAHPQAYLWFAISRQLWLSNSAINFVLYCLTGAKFRREFVSWIRCGAPRFSAPSPQETAVVEASEGQRHQQPGNSRVGK